MLKVVYLVTPHVCCTRSFDRIPPVVVPITAHSINIVESVLLNFMARTCIIAFNILVVGNGLPGTDVSFDDGEIPGTPTDGLRE